MQASVAVKAMTIVFMPRNPYHHLVRAFLKLKEVLAKC